MKISIYATLAAITLALPAAAQDGDAAKGEKEFNKCKACHMIQAPDGTDIIKAARPGPTFTASSAARSPRRRASNTAKASSRSPKRTPT